MILSSDILLVIFLTISDASELTGNETALNQAWIHVPKRRQTKLVDFDITVRRFLNQTDPISIFNSSESIEIETVINQAWVHWPTT